MLTFAALKFTCDPHNVYVIRTENSHSHRHLRFRKKFFVDRLMCIARWSCKQNCRCSDAIDNNDLLNTVDDDFREAEVLLMGNSRRNIVNLVRQYHPDLIVMKAIKQPEVKETIKVNESEKRRKRDKLPEFKSSRECQMMEKQFDCEMENDQNQLNRRIPISTPLQRSLEITAVLSSKPQSMSSQDYNDNAITAVDA